MNFKQTTLSGAFVIELDPHGDERGFFGRTFCSREFDQRGLVSSFVQCSMSFSSRKGTLRGLHFQRPPALEAKLVRCVAGAIFDVIVDLRPSSSTFGRHFGVELSASNLRSLYVPRGFAHGFQTLTDDVMLSYQISDFYVPELSAGVRWDDPGLAVCWPMAPSCLSEKDCSLPVMSELGDLSAMDGPSGR